MRGARSGAKHGAQHSAVGSPGNGRAGKPAVRARRTAKQAAAGRPSATEFAASLAPGESAPTFDGLRYQIDPARLIELQQSYARSLSQLWQETFEGRAQRPQDRRFSDQSWAGGHAYVAGLYMLNGQFMNALADAVVATPKVQAKIRFAVQQWVDAMSPSNYLATNPEAQKKLLDTGGESLAQGLANMLGDLNKGRISQTNEAAFEIGRNVAVSPGDVVFRNEIFELIQYRPSTATVFERPLLLVPPCINKFYILDLQPENSFVRHAVAQGHTVFLVSWRNPHAEQAHLTWDQYIEDGVIRAMRVVQQIGRAKTINVLGFCVGGTLVSTALAVLKARGERIAESLTLLTTLLDFANTGLLDVFVDEASVQMREHTIGGFGADGRPGSAVPGLMPGRDLATSFSFLRPNDLVWNYVVSNYLKGEAPPPFDLLYWNADSTNLPGPFFVWYLRNTYLENQLREPGGCQVCGEPVDLGSITLPSYVYASREDHIVPWHAAYANTQLVKGPVRFVLGASGHIAGVINPPAKGRRNYWIADGARALPRDPDQWFSGAREVPGSWWPDWIEWLSAFSGKKIKAPVKAGDAEHRPIEAAPGSYVRVRAA